MKHLVKLAAISCMVVMGVSGCAKERPEPPKAVQAQVDQHQDQGFVGIVKDQKLPLSSTKTIGTVFGEYKFFSSREWKESLNANGKVYVDFRGLFDGSASGQNGVSRQGVEVKFVVNKNGDLYIAMVSRIDVVADGTMKLYPLGDAARIVDLIYANKEIGF